MSVVVRTEEGKIVCMSKGADSIMIPRLSQGQEKLIGQTCKYLDKYANEGLRTLILTKKEVDPEFYKSWDARYKNAMCQIINREEQVNKIAEEIEQELTLVGSTAIEDKLQDDVGEVIFDIKAAGVKLWVLTGDKIETAINIGFSCQLLDQDMEIFLLDEKSSSKLFKQIVDCQAKQKLIGYSRDTAVVIGGEQLAKITLKKNEKILDEFVELARKANVVLACRVSPK